MREKLKKDHAKIIVILFWFLYILPLNISAQENILNASFAEKIYLQLDRKVYTNGDTIWFKCIVTNASDHTPNLLSGILYVELIGADESIRQKKLIKIKNGFGQGHFDLDKKTPKGTYLIRAYTQWNQNFDTNFFFEEYIQVFTKETQNTEPINSIKLIKEETASDHLEVLFNPEVLDSIQKNKLTVFVTIDDKKDSLVLKEKNNKYSLDYNIKKESQFATFKIETANKKNYTKKIVLNKDYLDLQFFPESGELVHGLSSKVGFKVLDAKGKGKFIEGNIVDENEAIITSFKSNPLGMGYFFIDNADCTKKYYAKVRLPNLRNKTSLFQLPNIATNGNTLTINKQENKILVKAFSNYMKNDSIFLRISFRGVELLEQKAKLNQGHYQSLLSITEIPEGIIAITLLDNSKNPLAERLYFNEKPLSRIKINLSTTKNKFTKRELTNLDIQTTNANDEPIKTNTSVLVINKEDLGTMQNVRQNILSYFLIDSELKGNLENPGYYFKNNDSLHDDLESLMLTQGWTKYNYSKPYKPPTFLPEKSLTISGKVNKLFAEKKGAKDIQLTLMTTGESQSFYNQATDSLGRFNFKLKDEYGKEIGLLIQTNKNSDKITSNSVEIDKKNSPSISFDNDKFIEQIDSIVENFIKKRLNQNETDFKFETQSGGILLDQVNIKAKMTANKQKVTELYGKPTTIIKGKDILSKEQKWSYGLYSILIFNFPNKLTIERTSEADLKAIVNNEPTLVIIDGIPVRLVEYPLIPYISPSEVSSFEIIENATGFGKLFCEVYPSGTCPKTGAFLTCIPPAFGHIIAIYTKAGIGLTGAQKPKGLTQSTIPVFATTKEFYVPKYDNIQPDDWKNADKRTLIHWQPILNTDDLGKAAISFYNTDNKGEAMIVVEAISEEGEIGYQELSYEIND
jgi:hypothetical protein